MACGGVGTRHCVWGCAFRQGTLPLPEGRPRAASLGGLAVCVGGGSWGHGYPPLCVGLRPPGTLPLPGGHPWAVSLGARVCACLRRRVPACLLCRPPPPPPPFPPFLRLPFGSVPFGSFSRWLVWCGAGWLAAPPPPPFVFSSLCCAVCRAVLLCPGSPAWCLVRAGWCLMFGWLRCWALCGPAVLCGPFLFWLVWCGSGRPAPLLLVFCVLCPLWRWVLCWPVFVFCVPLVPLVCWPVWCGVGWLAPLSSAPLCFFVPFCAVVVCPGLSVWCRPVLSVVGSSRCYVLWWLVLVFAVLSGPVLWRLVWCGAGWLAPPPPPLVFVVLCPAVLVWSGVPVRCLVLAGWFSLPLVPGGVGCCVCVFVFAVLLGPLLCWSARCGAGWLFPLPPPLFSFVLCRAGLVWLGAPAWCVVLGAGWLVFAAVGWLWCCVWWLLVVVFVVLCGSFSVVAGLVWRRFVGVLGVLSWCCSVWCGLGCPWVCWSGARWCVVCAGWSVGCWVVRVGVLWSQPACLGSGVCGVVLVRSGVGWFAVASAGSLWRCSPCFR